MAPRLIVIAALFMLTTARGETVEIVPREDTAAVVHNPDMGWVVYENFPIDRDPGGSSTMLACPGDSFAGVDYAAVMFSWADVEQREGVYDFGRVDEACRYWRERGKGIHLRMSTESLLWWAGRNPPAGTGIPEYVLDRLPADKKLRRTESGLHYWTVDAREPYYLARLKAFLEAVAAHFRDERAAALIDLRGFGLWGEWHSGYRYPTLADRRAALRGVLDVWSTGLADQQLALSYSHDPDGPAELYAGPYNRLDKSFTKDYQEFLEFSAFDHALTKPNITLRRDGAGGAVFSNQRQLCEEAFVNKRRAPFMSEFLGGYSAAKKGGDHRVRWMIDDALSLHPNYVCLLGWQAADAGAFLRDEPELVAHGLRTMGYRLVPLSVRCEPPLTPTAPLRLAMRWANRGVGRALRDYELRVRLVAVGRTVAMADAGPLPTSQWLKGEEHAVEAEAKFAAPLPGGSYALEIALWDPRTKRTINLPLAAASADGCYEIGRLEVGAAGGDR